MAGVESYRWVAVYTGSTRERYVQQPGWRKYRGMYRNRRLVRVYPPILTDDIQKAFRFSGPADIKRRLEHNWPGGRERDGWPRRIEARKI